MLFRSVGSCACVSKAYGDKLERRVLEMETTKILTIGREFGSEGHEIARMLSERLGVEIFDKDLLYKIAEKSGLEASELAAVDEKIAHKWLQPYLSFG